MSKSIPGYISAVLLVAAASLICEAVRQFIVPTNMVMVYLLAVVLAAAKLGLKPAILTATLSVIAFDVLFVPPRFSLRVADSEYLITFFALFVVGTVISTLVSRIKDKIEQIKSQQERTSSLYYLTRDLSGAVDMKSIVESLGRAVHRNFDSKAGVMLKKYDKLAAVESSNSLSPAPESEEIIDWVFRSGRQAGAGTAAFAHSLYSYLPIRSSEKVDGVMILEKHVISGAEDRQLMEAFAGQVALAIERVQFSAQAEEARVMHRKSRLEQALLNSISHDLRTPLVTISGVLDSLADGEQEYEPEQKLAMIRAASDEAGRLNRFVGSLLDMTRLEAGSVSPRFTVCDVEEIIGCAVGVIRAHSGVIALHVDVEPGLPPVSADLVLMTQVLVNVMENAVKYSPPGEEIYISARLRPPLVEIETADNGPGIPPGEEKRIFEKFYRIAAPEVTGGTGLGLSIAKGIVEAHGGVISAVNRLHQGLSVSIGLRAAVLDGGCGHDGGEQVFRGNSHSKLVGRNSCSAE